MLSVYLVDTKLVGRFGRVRKGGELGEGVDKSVMDMLAGERIVLMLNCGS